MLFSKLVTNTRSGLCRRAHLLEPRGVARVTVEARGRGRGRVYPLNQLRRVCLDASGECTDDAGKPCMKPWYDMSGDEAAACVNATQWCYATWATSGAAGIPRT
jgi:L-fucose isomerase